MEGEGAGDMFIDGTDGADKYDMNNTLGHEVIESVTALTGGPNDAAQEDQATAFGSHFADRVDQAFEGGINATSTGTFTTSLINSNAVSTGTNAANAASGANIDNRKFSGMHAMQFGSYVRRQQANGAMDNADAGEMLAILQELSNNRGSLDLNNELNNLDPAALGVSQESIDAVRDLPVGVLGRIVQMEPSDSCEGTACYVIAEMADTMVNHEHMGDLAMEIGGGMLLDSVVDGYRAYKAAKALDNITPNVSLVGDTSGFNTLGLVVDPKNSQEGRLLMQQFQQQYPDMSPAEIQRLAGSTLQSGDTLPQIMIGKPGDTFYKLVPTSETRGPSPTTVYWMDEFQLDDLMTGKVDIGSSFGLPNQTTTDTYKVYQTSVKESQAPLIFRNNIAPVVDDGIFKAGGESQTLLPKRSAFSDPIKILDENGDPLIIKSRQIQ